MTNFVLSIKIAYVQEHGVSFREAGEVLLSPRKEGSVVVGMLPIMMILLGTGLRVGCKPGAVPVLSSVADFTIPLVSSVRIGLASRVLLVQANTGSCVIGEPEWGGQAQCR